MAKPAPGNTGYSSKKRRRNGGGAGRLRNAAINKSEEGALRYGGLSREKPDWRVATWRAMRARTKLRKRAAPSRPASGARGGQAQRIKGIGKAWGAAWPLSPGNHW
ncbi:hypothetical protein [Comamonas sp. JUb58]|uniref:hypothetical protein n=1 Tax=Comamonas sp. JUb58 TaxID=2485114 RepID=UPI001061E326|nr:hypothetical protein [Comamonas sp. JUb58]